MDNDNKVIIQKPEVKLFLQDDVYAFNREKTETYNLEKEFAKAKKNKKNKNLIIMIALFIVMGILTFAVKEYINYQNKQITVNVEVFEDLNLKKLLDMVSKVQSQLEQAISDKSRNETDRQLELEILEADYNSSLHTISLMNISKSEKEERSRILKEENDLKTIGINEKYNNLATEIDVKIAEYKAQLEMYDSNNVERAQQQQAAIDSQKQLFDLEKKQLIDDYEVRIKELRDKIYEMQQKDLSEQKNVVNEISTQYQDQINLLDPVINDKRADLILSTMKTYGEISPFSLDSIEDVSELSDFYNTLQEADYELEAFEYISDIVLSVPQKNSIPKYVAAMRDIARHSGLIIAMDAASRITGLKKNVYTLETDLAESKKAMEEATISYKKEKQQMESDFKAEKQQMELSYAAEKQQMELKFEIEKKRLENLLQEQKEENAVLVKANSYFDTKALSTGENGYILNTTQKDKMLVYISPLHINDVDGKTAFVFRGQDKLIGTVKIICEGKFIYALPIEGDENKDFHPEDKLLLEIVK